MGNGDNLDGFIYLLIATVICALATKWFSKSPHDYLKLTIAIIATIVASVNAVISVIFLNPIGFIFMLFQYPFSALAVVALAVLTVWILKQILTFEYPSFAWAQKCRHCPKILIFAILFISAPAIMLLEDVHEDVSRKYEQPTSQATQPPLNSSEAMFHLTRLGDMRGRLESDIQKLVTLETQIKTCRHNPALATQCNQLQNTYTGIQQTVEGSHYFDALKAHAEPLGKLDTECQWYKKRMKDYVAARKKADRKANLNHLIPDCSNLRG